MLSFPQGFFLGRMWKFCEIAHQLQGVKKFTNNSKECILCTGFYINTPFTQYSDFQFLSDCVTVALVYSEVYLRCQTCGKRIWSNSGEYALNSQKYLRCRCRSGLVTFEGCLGTRKSTKLASLDVGNVCGHVWTSGGLYTLKEPTPLEWAWDSMRKLILAGDFPVILALLLHGSKAVIVHQYSPSVSIVLQSV